MGLVSKTGAKTLRKQVVGETDTRALELSGALYKHFNALHEVDFFPKNEVESLLLKAHEYEISQIGKFVNLPKGLARFNPSGASKCERELYYKAIKETQDEKTMYPFQRRWTRNASVVHSAVQRDLLYAEILLKNPEFMVKRLENGLPAWEKSLQTAKVFNHNGIRFGVVGMMDGILEYKDGTEIGFEFKTKSTTIGAVGNYKMKDAQDSHKQQCIAYSLLFGLDEYILMYESLAKDNWNSGAQSKLDFRTFYYKVSEQDRQALLDKWARVAKQVQEITPPDREPDKCIFCPFKTVCEEV